MKDVGNLKKLMLYMGMFFLVFGLNSCNNDDDGDIIVVSTGFFAVDEVQILTGNMLMLESITVGQDSWLVAVNPGDENTDNFISEPEWLQEGVNTNVALTLNESAVPTDGNGKQIVLKLYSDDGTQGVWDSADEPVMTPEGLLLTETVFVYAEDSNQAAFFSFDADGDGVLDMNEVPNTYQNNFEVWDVDADGMLSSEEFYNTTFLVTDADNDNFINVDEWALGYNSMYTSYVNNDFATYDIDGDGFLEVTEWNAVFTDSQWFEAYDADANTFVSDTEWDTGLFGDWDLDGDEFIDTDEFNTYYDYVTFW